MKNSYRKVLALVLTLAICVMPLLSACGKPVELSDKIKIGSLNGPTGMGLIDLQDNEMVEMSTYQAPDEVVQKLISGDLDVACLPSNMGAVLNAKMQGNVKVLTTIVNGVLYVVENKGNAEAVVTDVSGLKGKTIIASGKGGTPEYVLQALLDNAGLEMDKDVKVEWLDAHADVAQKVMMNEGSLALVPEPFVSTILSKSPKTEIAIDMNEAWKTMTGSELPMGILIAKKDLVENRASDVEALLELVSASIEDVKSASDEVAAKITEAGFIGDAELCKDVIPRLSLTCMSSEDSRTTLTTFYETLFEVTPAAVGGAVPDESLFY
ncbi:MAG: ABC transporter substrate-binding protein [Mogibacterium sp.]|nr:ABC transporter substrate-binding protein [Mogibacterium sp.]